MSEIRTCEQYVLAELERLQDAREEVERLRVENEALREANEELRKAVGKVIGIALGVEPDEATGDE